MKRNQPDSENADDQDVKQRKIDKGVDGENGLNSEDEGAAILEPFMADLDAIQMEMQQLDKQCASEQMSIQKQYDEKKKPVLEKRQKILDKIPGFWCRALRHHPALACTIEEDIPALQLLQRIELSDNLDDHGSYKIRFTFLPEIKEYFSPESIEKEVRFSEDLEQEVKVSPIEWVNEKNLVEIAKKKRQELEEKDEIDDAEQPWSIFEWFSEENQEYRIDIGEVIRREIWHQPVGYFMDPAAEEDEEDDDDYDDEKQGDDDDDGRDEEEIDEEEDDGEDVEGDGDDGEEE